MKMMETSELAHVAYTAWIASFYGVYPAANIKLWEQLPDKTQKAWESVVLTCYAQFRCELNIASGDVIPNVEGDNL